MVRARAQTCLGNDLFLRGGTAKKEESQQLGRRGLPARRTHLGDNFPVGLGQELGRKLALEVGKEDVFGC